MFSFAQNYLTRGFWGDEAWTSLISQLPYLQMLKTTAADFHPPGYYTVVELVYRILPPTEIATRSISIFFYFLTGIMVFKLASVIFSTSDESKPTSEVSRVALSGGRLFGFLSALLVLVNPIFFRYAFEARNYTMFAFCATASMYFLVRICSAHSRSEPGSNLAHSGSVYLWNIVGFILVTALGIYTHYFMFFVIAAQGLYLLLFERKTFLHAIAAYFVIGVLYLGWIPFLLGQLKSVSGDYWISGIDWKHTHIDALRRILGGEQDSFYQLLLFRFSILLILVGLILHLRQWANWRIEKSYLLIWLWVVVPFVIATLPGLRIDGITLPFRPVFFWRYLIPAAIPLSLLIVHSSWKLPRAVFAFSMGFVIVLSLLIDYWTFKSYPYNFMQAYEQKVLPNVIASDQLVTILPSFAEVLYYKNRNNLENQLIVLPEGLVQFSGKSLLDAYLANGFVTIEDAPTMGRQFILTPGPTVSLIER